MNPPDRKHVLADAIRSRRNELGLRQDELREFGGPSAQTVLDYEACKIPDEPQARTLQGFDRALRWKIGTSYRILNTEGAEPVPADVAEDRRDAQRFQATFQPVLGNTAPDDPWVPVRASLIKDLSMKASKLLVAARLEQCPPGHMEYITGIHGIAGDMLALAIGVELGDDELMNLVSKLSGQGQ
ncbi:hypothetical protein [Rhodococcus sp. 11-3]|uniref:hypothetical protein n=1 Tax=Rhodococcus sp. 11-3 TaxID=2854796 RepID=UPI002040DD29|nr:hypothetical protein [Rhodococcus sp. 11-3]USC16971.1 hypothetical protein KZJ41_08950 [Rhodococcus sp. 11-3]